MYSYFRKLGLVIKVLPVLEYFTRDKICIFMIDITKKDYAFIIHSPHHLEKLLCLMGIESRGFIFGPPIALAIGAKFVPSRKPKKLRDELAALDGKCFSHVDQYAIVKLSVQEQIHFMEPLQIKSLQPILPKSVLAALKADSKAAHIWTNLANAYYLMSDHRSSAKCLEKAGKIKPNCLATRYAVGFHRIRDAERLQNPKSSSHGLVVRWTVTIGVILSSPSKHYVESDWINEGGFEIEPFDSYVICPSLSTMRTSYQTLIEHHPNPFV
ncbi:hypothetical protein FXO37_35106 [Capsicum annuum]|nr:hypothetical protein FXO37_35106 [Capsicum annuum]